MLMPKGSSTISPTDPVRSAIMRSVRAEDTGPELFIRRVLHRLGYRFRLHDKRLPGKPDIVFAGRQKVVFVHGCFWHAHECARGSRVPKTNREYWVQKIGHNKERDKEHVAGLKALGWKALIIWECEMGSSEKLASRLIRFLG